MSVELTTLISILSIIVATFGAIVGYQTFQFKKMNNTKKDTKADAENDAEMRSELKYIRTGVDDIKIDLKANEKQISAQGERLTRVEESTKQAHKRIDHLEGPE